MALRLLVQLSVDDHCDQGDVGNHERYVELKYAYAVVQLFSHDMLRVLVDVLHNLCLFYEQPDVHGAVLAGPQGCSLLAIVHPALRSVLRPPSLLLVSVDSTFHSTPTLFASLLILIRCVSL